MTIRKTDVVDRLGLEKGTGRVVLAVIDDEDWTNEHEHLHLLENKLNTYLAFIESGQVYERLAEDLGREVPKSREIQVQLLARYDPTARAKDFLEYARDTFANAGFGFTHEVVRVANER